MKIVVTGGRHYSDSGMVNDVLDALNPTDVYVGDATGADELARDWADSRGKNLNIFVADWNTHGKAAGPIRNKDMLEYAWEECADQEDHLIVVAFPGGDGTANCVKQAIERNMIVFRVEA